MPTKLFFSKILSIFLIAMLFIPASVQANSMQFSPALEPGTLDHITISPTNPSVIAGQTQQFTATGYDASDTAIPGLSFTWGITSGNTAAGSINSTGLFTAGASPASYPGAIQASNTGINGTASVTVTATTLHHFSFDAIQSPRYASQPFPVTLRAFDSTNIPVITYTGTASISTNSGTVSPTTTTSFVAGVWTGFVTLSPAATGVTLTATSSSITGTSNSITVQAGPTCPCTIWDSTTPTGSLDVTDNMPIEVGEKFQSDVSGYVKGVRFYKGNINTGTHVGHLWKSDGTLLASVTFTNETASGWQEANFSAPVAISAYTTYVISYHSQAYYTQTANAFTTAGIYNPPLHVLADGMDGNNGVYSYGASATFPTTGASSSNYWVDVLFDTVPPQPTSIWGLSDTPQNANATNASGSSEYGVRLQSSVSGKITGVRFYKGSSNTGTFWGHLWDNSGSQLAEASLTDGTSASGWQDIVFASPIPISANTTYVASYFSPGQYYAVTSNYFSTAHTHPPLTALANNSPDPNGVYVNNSNHHTFPSTSGSGANYWVDVVFQPDVYIDNTPPTVLSVSPANAATGVSVTTSIKVSFSEAINPATVSTATIELRDNANNLVPATVTYNSITQVAQLQPSAFLAYSTQYTGKVKGGTGGVADISGNLLASDDTWSFTTGASPAIPADEGPGGPILVVSAAANPFSRYYTEILRAEGLNEFRAMDISEVTAPTLNSYQVVILGEVPLTSGQVTMFTNWVNAGGNLIAMRPDKQLSNLLGLTASSSTLSNAYLLIDTGTVPGAGLVNQTIQYHGSADVYSLNGATSLAKLYSDASTQTTNPAVTQRSVGTLGGHAAAFTYDLAKSVVYTRQGNPAWAGQERDSVAPIRSDDLFYGNAAGDLQPDWIDLNKVAIPQADEQQRLLANLILSMNQDTTPLPRFWYFPRGAKAVVVMTGDDHSSPTGVADRFDIFKGDSSAGCSVDDWECIRSTAYVYANNGLTPEQAATYVGQGFEVALHVNTDCLDWTAASLGSAYTSQLADFAANYAAIPAPSTNRAHCVVWSDWDSQAHIELANNIRLDTNYYFWPSTWVNNVPGLFTGSGMPMRFADLDGKIVDVYQATTQMTDESGQSYPATINALLDKATGSVGYYGAFTANLHSDTTDQSAAQAIVNSAQSHGVPVISASQLLTWLDGRNTSSFQSIAWNGSNLNFTVATNAGARGLQALLPTHSSQGVLQSLSLGGNPVSYTKTTLKGMEYAVFLAGAGAYSAAYAPDTTPPVISNVSAVANGYGQATITWNTDEPSDSTVLYGTTSSLGQSSIEAALVTSHSITLSGLTTQTRYYYRVTSADANHNLATYPLNANPPATFDTPNPMVTDTTALDFQAGSGNCWVDAHNGDGAVRLPESLDEEFTGSSLPENWSSYAWVTNGTASVNGVSLSVNGAIARDDTVFNPGIALEFVATFSAQPKQHIGFGGGENTFTAGPWAIFSTGEAGTQLQARVLPGETNIDLGSSYLGSPHRYRIDWNASTIVFSIDGTQVANVSATISDSMRVAFSDASISDSALSVDWVGVTPYASPCTFTSRTFDAGKTLTWDSLSWTSTLPTGTTLGLSYRSGNSADLSGVSWTSAAGSSPVTLSTQARYFQYQAALSTTDLNQSPVLKDVTFSYHDSLDTTPPTLQTKSPAQGATGVSISTAVTATFSEQIKASTLTTSSVSLRADGAGTDVAASVSYDAVTFTATLTPTSSLAPGVLYHATLSTAITDLAGNPYAGSTWSFTTLPLPGAFNRSAPGDGSTGVSPHPTLTWETSPDATSYQYCYSSDKSCSWINVSTTSAPLSSLDPGVTYFWKVRAHNASGDTLVTGDWWSFTTLPLPGAFNRLTPSDGATGVVIPPALTWEPSSDATSYQYCYSSDKSCSWMDASSTNISLSGLDPVTTYYWKVRARNASGDTLVNGDWWSFTTSSTVQLVSFTGVWQSGSVQINWETGNEVGLQGFNLYRSATADGTKEPLNATLIPGKKSGQAQGDTYEFVDATPKPGQHYFYWLEVVRTDGTVSFGPVEVNTMYLIFLPNVRK